MELLSTRLTLREKEWIKEYFKAGGNATEAIRKVYGGTPGACRVKGHKKVKKFRPILKEIQERELYKMEYQGMTGIDLYLGCLQEHSKEGN